MEIIKKIIILFLTLWFIFTVSVIVASAYTFEQIPDEQDIIIGTPVTTSITFDTATDTEIDFSGCVLTGTCSARLYLGGVENYPTEGSFGEIYAEQCQPIFEGENTVSFEFNDLPLGGVEGVGIAIYDESSCVNLFASFEYDYDGGSPDYVFSIVEEPTPPTPPENFPSNQRIVSVVCETEDSITTCDYIYETSAPIQIDFASTSEYAIQMGIGSQVYIFFAIVVLIIGMGLILRVKM